MPSGRDWGVIVGVIEGIYPGIVEVYKQDQGGGESGSMFGNYSTCFQIPPLPRKTH